MPRRNQNHLPPELRTRMGRPPEGEGSNSLLLTVRISARLKAALEEAALEGESPARVARRLLEELLIQEPEP
jgi:hypothetical protein